MYGVPGEESKVHKKNSEMQEQVIKKSGKYAGKLGEKRADTININIDLDSYTELAQEYLAKLACMKMYDRN